MATRRSRALPLAVLALLACATASAPAAEDRPTITFAFESNSERVDCGGVLTGAPGETLQVEFFATIESSDNPTDHGIGGWTLSIHGENLRFVPGSASSVDVVDVPLFFFAPTVVDPDAVPSEGPLQGQPQGQGIIDGVALAVGREFPLESVERVLRFTVEVTVPQLGEDPTVAELSFVDGKKGGGIPLENDVAFEGLAVLPDVRRSCSFTVQPAVFRRGDVDANGTLEITDAIVLLRHLFLGGDAPVCADAADADDSGALDLTDAIFNLGFQFLGDTPPPAPGPHACGPDTTPADPPLAPCRYPPAGCGS